MKLGNIDIADIKLGASQVSAWFGGVLVWGGEEPAAGPWLCFTARQSNSTAALSAIGSPNAVSLEYSTNGSSWADYEFTGSAGEQLTLANVGDKVYMRAKNENTTIGSSTSNYYKFVMTGKIAASGNIQTLLKADGSRTDAPAYCYYQMFTGSKSLTQAPELPATTLEGRCYQNMFAKCTSLASAPALPATAIGWYCYLNMFDGCSSLTAAPALPATTLKNNCYSGMFRNCTSLTAAPALSAATLVESCYSEMFSGCSSLTAAPAVYATTVGDWCCYRMFYNCTSLATAPVLSATTLSNGCYQQMFNGCTSLSSVDVAFTSWGVGSETNNWLNNVAASGTFTCPAELSDIRDASHIPTSWNVVNPSQELSAVCFTAEEANSTVKLYKYNSGAPTLDIETSTDGSTWSAYTQGTVLTAANVGDKVYFRAGSAGNTTISTTSNTNRFAITGKMAASGDIQYLLSQDGTTQPTVNWCFNCLFYGQSSLTKAPKCGATGLLPRECYGGTFEKCTGLTEYVDTPLPQAWEDGATNLQHWVYVNMFNGCTNLSAIAVDWTSWPKEGSSYTTQTWLQNIAASGTFICPSQLADIRGDNNIPTGWTKVDAT